MTSAVFGRMEMGRCVEEDFGFLGCQNDALDIIDAECSGRKECQVLVSKQKFRKSDVGACRRALTGYLAASYQCFHGIFAQLINNALYCIPQ